MPQTMHRCPECRQKLIEEWDEPRGKRFFFLWCEMCEQVRDIRFPNTDYTFTGPEYAELAPPPSRRLRRR